MKVFVYRTRGLALSMFLIGMASTNPSYAVDGVIEINQVAVKVGGITPGDTPLFPVTISQPGSYRLTSNLDVTDASARPDGTNTANTSAIEVEADGVNIDLNGFAIIGPTFCERSLGATNCAPLGTGSGISGVGNHRPNVKNGTVMKMGAAGIQFTGRVEAVTSISNGGLGIMAEIANDCVARRNHDTGISTVLAHGCISSENGGDGFSGGSSIVTSSFASLNTGHGFSMNGGVLRGNTSNGNVGFGIRFLTGGICANNSVFANDAGTMDNCTQLVDSVCNNSVVCP